MSTTGSSLQKQSGKSGAVESKGHRARSLTEKQDLGNGHKRPAASGVVDLLPFPLFSIITSDFQRPRRGRRAHYARQDKRHVVHALLRWASQQWRPAVFLVPIHQVV
jgi:hypothetical protein